MPDQRICVFLSQRYERDSSGEAAADVVYETLILPAMERFPDFVTQQQGYDHEPGSISIRLV
jgi:hypothetical protein